MCVCDSDGFRYVGVDVIFGSGDGGRRVIEETFNANTRRPCTTYFFRYLSYCILLLDCKIII